MTTNQDQKSENGANAKDRPLWLAAFLVALGFYLVFFFGVEHLRTRKGPWVVTFGFGSNRTPMLEVSQSWLGISNLAITFPGTNAPRPAAAQTVRFSSPVDRELAFGRIKFLDTTFLPGTVTLDLFGHEIELLPRVLIIDKQEHPWPRVPAQIGVSSYY